jgi:hypothetical protein
MSSSADECWRLSGDCSRWAEESHDNATRLAFRQMAKVWAQFAFSHHFTMPSDNEPVGAPENSESSESSKNSESSEGSEATPTNTRFRTRFP